MNHLKIIALDCAPSTATESAGINHAQTFVKFAKYSLK
jgi:hypothetical protein